VRRASMLMQDHSHVYGSVSGKGGVNQIPPAIYQPKPRLTPPTPPPYTDERLGLWRSWERA
jgi:hypothetical protein